MLVLLNRIVLIQVGEKRKRKGGVGWGKGVGGENCIFFLEEGKKEKKLCNADLIPFVTGGGKHTLTPPPM